MSASDEAMEAAKHWYRFGHRLDESERQGALALALDAFASQAVAEERERCTRLGLRVAGLESCIDDVVARLGPGHWVTNAFAPLRSKP